MSGLVAGEHEIERSGADKVGSCTVHVKTETMEQALEHMKSSYYTGEEEMVFGLPKAFIHEI